MALAVRQLDNFQFDSNLLNLELTNIIGLVGNLNAQQVLLIDFESTSKIDLLVGTYTETVIEQVIEIAAKQMKKVGRVRLMTLLPKTSHPSDVEQCSFQIPLTTSGAAFFISKDQIDRMPVAGQLYLFNANGNHTVVNSNQIERRAHIVFDTY